MKEEKAQFREQSQAMYANLQELEAALSDKSDEVIGLNVKNKKLLKIQNQKIAELESVLK